MAAHEEAKDETLLCMVNGYIELNSRGKLVDIIGSEFERWKAKVVKSDMSFNPIATALYLDKDKPLRHCQKRGCCNWRAKSDKPEDYEGELFCEQCLEDGSAVAALTAQLETGQKPCTKEATWCKLVSGVVGVLADFLQSVLSLV